MTSAVLLGAVFSVHATAQAQHPDETPLHTGITHRWWGGNIHRSHAGSTTLQILASGFRIARMDMKWAVVEPAAPAEYNWTAYDGLVAELDQHGVLPYFILDG